MTASRHVVVTGGGRGIGAAIAAAMVAAGDRVTITGRDAARLAACAASLGEGCRTVVIDVADPGSVECGLAEAREGFGPIEILVNNAGQAASAPFARTTDDLWQRMIAVNLSGTFHCMRAALPDMLAAGRGRIVNVASTAGQRGYAYVAAYAAAKHGVIGLTRSLALEVAAKGITVNAVCPGYTDTDLLRESVANVVAKTGRGEDAALAEFTRSNPQGRLIQPEEVAAAVAWLCCDAAASVTGQAISISGGEVM